MERTIYFHYIAQVPSHWFFLHCRSSISFPSHSLYIYRTSEPPATQNTVAGENLTKRLRGPCLFSKLIEDDSAYRFLMTYVCNVCI